MHPILSEIAISHRAAGIQANLETRRKLHLAHQASTHASMTGAVTRLTASVVNAVRQVVDPRGYAMSRFERREALPLPAGPVLETGFAAPSAEPVAALAARRCQPRPMAPGNRLGTSDSLGEETATAA